MAQKSHLRKWDRARGELIKIQTLKKAWENERTEKSCQKSTTHSDTQGENVGQNEVGDTWAIQSRFVQIMLQK